MTATTKARTDEECRQQARHIVYEARSAEWRRLNAEMEANACCGEYGVAEELLHQMGRLLDKNVAALVESLPECDQDRVSMEVTKYFGRLCGLIA